MNILQITSDWKWTGPAEPMLLLLEALKARGHRVILSCPAAPTAEVRGVAERAGDRGISNRLELMPARGARWFRDSVDASRLADLLREDEIDILHTWHTRDHVLAWRARRQASSHQDTAVVRTLGAADRVSRWPWNRLLLGPGCQGLLCPGERAVQQNSGLRGGRPIGPWFGAVSTQRFAADAGAAVDRSFLRDALGLDERVPGRGLIGVVARVQKHRRFDLLLEAMAKLVQTHPHARLLVIGRGTHLDTVAREPAARLGLADQVVFTGYRDGDYPALIASLDFLTFLVPGSDGTCRAVLEAAASGLPAVVARRGILPELVAHGETGLVVEEDPAALAEAWRRLLDDREEASRMGLAARQRAEQVFASEQAAAALEDFYADVLGAAAG